MLPLNSSLAEDPFFELLLHDGYSPDCFQRINEYKGGYEAINGFGTIAYIVVLVKRKAYLVKIIDLSGNRRRLPQPSNLRMEGGGQPEGRLQPFKLTDSWRSTGAT